MTRTHSPLKRVQFAHNVSRFILATLLAVGAALLVLPSHGAEPGQPLPWRVGIAKADITPPLEVGILMSTGRRAWQPFEGVRMPLEARALVVERDGRRLAVVSLDSGQGQLEPRQHIHARQQLDEEAFGLSAPSREHEDTSCTHEMHDLRTRYRHDILGK